MRILLVSDAWRPQINGVVRTLEHLSRHLRGRGHEVEVIGPGGFLTVRCPVYPEISLALAPGRRLRDLVDAFKPDAVHIATEGPLGGAMRRLCLAHGWPFTTDYHTRFPQYLRRMAFIPEWLTRAVLRRFHSASRRVLVGTPSMREELLRRGFQRVELLSRGVDAELFRPTGGGMFDGLPRPVLLYVGRVSKEKSLPDFLRLPLAGTKVVVGDGPVRRSLERRFPDVLFPGALTGEPLARAYSSADVFVFPSRTDTFGLVLLEALACGLPVAALPVTGPRDVLTDPSCACLDEDLARAVEKALTLSRARAREHALRFSWESVARRLEEMLEPLSQDGRRSPAAPASVQAVSTRRVR